MINLWIERRLYDVFFSGLIYIYFSTFINNWPLKTYVFLIGFLNILYNGHNYLLLDKKILDRSLIPKMVTEHGKTQWHRIYNLLIMYPLLAYANEITMKPKLFTYGLRVMIFLGFSVNLFNFCKISYEKYLKHKNT